MSGGMTRAVARLGAALAALSLQAAGRGLAAASAPETIIVPFEISAGRLLAPITVKGRPQQAILGTGAPRALIDKSYAASLGMESGWLSRLLGQGRGAANGVD